MCGRYVLHLRPSEVRQRLVDQSMPADSAPDDDNNQIRQTYNFAPGYHGLIYRAEASSHGAGSEVTNDRGDDEGGEPRRKKAKHTHLTETNVDGLGTKETKYKLQAAKWGLIPFWTKRSPDYSSQLKTINCRDDSLAQPGGMWNTMKQRKRCLVIAEGFYEWLKKNGGKEKIPHFVKRKDGGLMCLAGLWDCVQYEGEEQKIWSYTIITTDSNKQLSFLHDRMPVILEPGSEGMKIWLDPDRVGWDKELQSLLRPFEGELDCYPVDNAVGKVGNNSPSFVIPVDSKENKKNIANFFGKQKEKAENNPRHEKTISHEGKDMDTSRLEETEGNAPLPKPSSQPEASFEQAVKSETKTLDDTSLIKAVDDTVERPIKLEIDRVDDCSLLTATESPARTGVKRELSSSPVKTRLGKKMRNATSNESSEKGKTPKKDGNARITAFFGK